MLHVACIKGERQDDSARVFVPGVIRVKRSASWYTSRHCCSLCGVRVGCIQRQTRDNAPCFNCRGGLLRICGSRDASEGMFDQDVTPSIQMGVVSATLFG